MAGYFFNAGARKHCRKKGKRIYQEISKTNELESSSLKYECRIKSSLTTKTV